MEVERDIGASRAGTADLMPAVGEQERGAEPHPLLAAQQTVGNQAVQRSVLADEWRYRNIATTIHDQLVVWLFWDEKVIYEALEPIGGDATKSARLQESYRLLYARDLYTDLVDKLEGPKLYEALRLLGLTSRARRISEEDLAVIGRLSAAAPVLEAEHALETAEAFGQGVDPMERGALAKAAGEVAAARRSYTAAAARAGFEDVEDYQRTKVRFQSFFERFALQTALVLLDRSAAAITRESGRMLQAGVAETIFTRLAPARDKARQAAGAASAFMVGLGTHERATLRPADEARLAEATRLQSEADALVAGVAKDYALVGDVHLDRHALLSAGNANELSRLLVGDATARIEDIRLTRGNLLEDPTRVWELEPLIRHVIEELRLNGTVYEAIAVDRMHEASTGTMFRELALGALALALGIVSGGTGAVAAAAAVGLAGVSGYTLLEHFEQYEFQKAAAGTALDRASALLAEDPSAAWLVLDLIGFGLDLGAATMALHELVPAAKALRAGESGTEALRARALAVGEQLVRERKVASAEAFANEVVAAAERERAALLARADRPPPLAAAGHERPPTGTPRGLGGIPQHSRYGLVNLAEGITEAQFELVLKELELTATGREIAGRIRAGTLPTVVTHEPIALGTAGLAVKKEIQVVWHPSSVEETASTLMHEGAHFIDPRLMQPGVTRVEMEVEARIAEFEYRALKKLPERDAAEGIYQALLADRLAKGVSREQALAEARKGIADMLVVRPEHYGVETAEELERGAKAAGTGKPAPSPAPLRAPARTNDRMTRAIDDLELRLDRLPSHPDREGIANQIDFVRAALAKGEDARASAALTGLERRIAAAEVQEAKGAFEQLYDIGEGVAGQRVIEYVPAGERIPVPLDATAPAAADETGQRLLQHVRKAVAQFESEQKLTAKQLEALRQHNLYDAYRGSEIDRLAKASVFDDPALEHVYVTVNFEKGADFFDSNTGHWYDMTTTGAWKKHVRDYGGSQAGRAAVPGFRLAIEP